MIIYENMIFQLKERERKQETCLMFVFTPNVMSHSIRFCRKICETGYDM